MAEFSLKTKGKEGKKKKSLKEVRQKQWITYREIRILVTVDFSSETLVGRRK